MWIQNLHIIIIITITNCTTAQWFLFNVLFKPIFFKLFTLKIIKNKKIKLKYIVIKAWQKQLNMKPTFYVSVNTIFWSLTKNKIK